MIPCDSTVTRQGVTYACGKPAVTWMDPEVWFEEYGIDLEPWPVCAYHAHMGRALPLDQHPRKEEQ